MNLTNRQVGFTLVELMIGLVILSTLLALAFPAFTVMMQNARVLSAAESFSTGLQLARAEAVRRNTTADFVVLGTANPATAASKDVTVGDAAGQSWIVRTSTPTTPPTTPPTFEFEFVDGKSVKEGSASVVAVASAAPIITFTSLGATTLTAPALFQFTSGTGRACQRTGETGDIRCMNVRVSVGGSTRLCDPIATGSDSRSC
jgi:type IV fimbrial biogenesis protein FimT